MKKIAFVHDWIVHLGGGEKVFKDLIDHIDFDEACVFTLYSQDLFFTTTAGKIKIVTALPRRIFSIFTRFSGKRIFFLSTLFDYRNLMFFFPILVKILSQKIQKYNPTETVISSFAAVKNISVTSKAKLYLHSPMQYVHENYNEYLTKLKFPIKNIFMFIAKKLKKRDQQKRNFDTIFFNSTYTQSVAEKIYSFKGQVLYPLLEKEYTHTTAVLKPKEYYVYIGRLVKFVREADKIIKLFNEIKLPLLVMGSGPDEIYLKSLAQGHIIFLGQVNDVHEKIKILKNARGLVNLAKESFGLGTAEALALGVPVFGFAQGGTAELVSKTSGVLVPSKDHLTLLAGFSEFIKKKFDRAAIQEQFKHSYAEHTQHWEQLH